jgi:mannose-6-phosphate isomerase-like protein (cupin superfamily)
MPVLQTMSGAPAWCELQRYSIISLAAGDKHRWSAAYDANKLVVVTGACAVGAQQLERGKTLDVPAGEHAVTTTDGATVVELGGHWGDDCGGAGLFGVAEATELGDIGDPVDYPKRTNFDRHYHDCDEYWILVSGRGTASSENVLYEVGPGDCVATRMGNHHDFPLVEEPVLAVFFETTMRGQGRRGHLWEHTHGPAVPATDGSE